jgi:hypothetical protein
MRRQLYLVAMVLITLLTALPAWATLITLTPTDDVYVATGGNANNNYTTSASLYLATNAIPYLKFNLSSIPDGSTLVSATLNLYPRQVPTQVTGQLSRISNDTWSKSEVTYNTRPDLSGTVASLTTQTISTEEQWLLWSFGNTWTQFNDDLNDNYLSLNITRTSGNYAVLSSTRASSGQWPTLTIDYNAPSAVPIPAAVWLLGSGLIGLIGLRRRFKK